MFHSKLNKHRNKNRRNNILYMFLFGIILILITFYIIWKIILLHGTFLPPFVQLRTVSYTKHIPAMPKDFKPNFRVVVSFTSVPHNINKIRPTIDSLLSQSYIPDKIYINIPLGLYRNKTLHFVPKFISQYNNSIVSVIRSSLDYGPLTKLYPTLEHENDENTLIITVDDDKIYPKHLIKTLSYYSFIDNNIAIGDCGWSFQKIPHKQEVIPVYVPFMFRGKSGRKVEVLQAVCGNAYRRKFFKNLTLLASYPKQCFTTDDLWISGYLNFVNSKPIKRLLIKERLEPKNPNWKNNDENNHKTLSFDNTKNSNDIKCIRAVESKFDKSWLYK